MKENIKILYIHGFNIIGESRKQKLLENALGKDNVISCDVNTRSDIITFILFLLFIISIVIFNSYVAFMFSNPIIFGITVTTSVIVTVIMYFVLSHLILYHIMKKSIKKAEQKLNKEDPDVIIGIYFGAVVAMNLKYKNGKKPLVLISPSVQTFQKYTHNVDLDISTFPYIIIVNGSKDKMNPVSICQQLIAQLPEERGRLEILDDNHLYSTIKEADIKEWVKEANNSPSAIINNVSKQLKHHNVGKKIEIYSSTSYMNDNNTINDEKEPLV